MGPGPAIDAHALAATPSPVSDGGDNHAKVTCSVIGGPRHHQDVASGCLHQEGAATVLRGDLLVADPPTRDVPGGPSESRSGSRTRRWPRLDGQSTRSLLRRRPGGRPEGAPERCRDPAASGGPRSAHPEALGSHLTWTWRKVNSEVAFTQYYAPRKSANPWA